MLALFLFPLYFGLQRCQLITVTQHLLDEGKLEVDDSVLLYYQAGQQSIRDQEKNYEHRKQAVLRFCWEIRVTELVGQGAPRVFASYRRQASNLQLASH